MKSLLSLSFLALLGSALGGCASDQDHWKIGHSYVVEQVADTPLINASHLSLTLAADGRAFGKGGCNQWFAPYTLKGQQLSFGTIGSTRIMCDEALMDQEQRLFNALEKVQRWDVSPTGHLRLWPTEGKPMRLWL